MIFRKYRSWDCFVELVSLYICYSAGRSASETAAPRDPSVSGGSGIDAAGGKGQNRLLSFLLMPPQLLRVGL